MDYQNIILTIANNILASKQCEYRFTFNDIVTNLPYYTNYCITKIKYAKNGFGFTENGVFCHTSKGMFCDTSLDKMDADMVYLICIGHTNKGWSAKWFSPITASETKETLKTILREPLFHLIHKKEQLELYRSELAREEAAKKAALQELGIESYLITNIKTNRNNDNDFRNYYYATYEFKKEINKDIFVKFLKIIGEKTESEEPEYISISGNRKVWRYEWETYDY